MSKYNLSYGASYLQMTIILAHPKCLCHFDCKLDATGLIPIFFKIFHVQGPITPNKTTVTVLLTS